MVAAVPIDPWMERQRAALLRMMPLTESPAEAMLLPALLAHGGPDDYVLGPAGRWALEAQVTVPTGGRTYRVDFAATRGKHKVAIEVDGWQHHHATDDQEAYDACRDWALGDRGWVVARLDAWRVFKEPSAAVALVIHSLADVERTARRVAVKPVEGQTDEEFERHIQPLVSAVDAAKAVGVHEEAVANQQKIDRMMALRAKARMVQALRNAPDAAAEEELLRSIFHRRTQQGGRR